MADVKTNDAASRSGPPPVPDAALLKDKGFIDRRWVSSAKTFTVTNPATGETLADVADLTSDDTRDAISAASCAFPIWSGLMPAARTIILRRWADLIDRDADKLALLMTLEQGKPLKEAKGEVTSGAATIRWCAEEGSRAYGDFINGPKAGTRIVVSYHPIGVVGAITPWNFPVGMITRKVAPALAAGCTVVLKPAEATPLCALALAALAEEAEVPSGVLNIVPTTDAAGVGAALTSDARVRKISFTGSTAVGKTLMAAASAHVQKISLELGGNAPFIVFESADLEKAAEGAIVSKFRNAGQTCICANRIYVQKTVLQPFLKIFETKLRALKTGHGWNAQTDLGPLIDSKALDKVRRLVDDARQSGAKVLTGGQPHTIGGNFYEPTLLFCDNDGAAMVQEEIFGPVAAVYPFSSEDELVQRANDTAFGLAAYIYGKDMAQLWRVSDRLEYGMVGVNEPLLSNDLAPFGGVKESGIGREGGAYGLKEYYEMKYRLWSDNG